MGGASNSKIKQETKYDKAIWRAMERLSLDHIDDFPFSAEEVATWLGKKNSAAMITRNRGGLKQMLLKKREAFIRELEPIVEEEVMRTGDISQAFCRRLGLLITMHGSLFIIDINSHSHRNTEILLGPVKVLINSKAYCPFGSGLYILLVHWYKNDGFTRESVLEKYESRIRSLFLRYQITRPDMSVAMRG